MVAFYGSAELNCMAALGWSLPENVIDLFVENRVETNGADLLGLSNSLLDALALRGIPHITAEHKQSTIDLILSVRNHSPEQRQQISSIVNPTWLPCATYSKRCCPALTFRARC